MSSLLALFVAVIVSAEVFKEQKELKVFEASRFK